MDQEIKRGEIYFANLGETNVGSEQYGTRPVLIIQNDVGNRYSPTTIVACITSRMYKNQIPTHVKLEGNMYGLGEDSLILCEQIKTLDKRRLLGKVVELNHSDMAKVDKALKLSMQLL